MSEKLPDIAKYYSEGPIARDREVEERFCRRFTDTWNRIPAQDREELERYFASNGNRLAVQLRDSHHRFKEGPSKDAAAQYIHHIGTDTVVFKSSVIKRLEDRSCGYLISHELAHLFLHMRDSAHGFDKEAAEAEVAEFLLNRWNYERSYEEELNSELHLIRLVPEGKR